MYIYSVMTGIISIFMEEREMTREEVLQKREEYERALEEYHTGSATTVRVEMGRDEYRGNYCCEVVVDEVELENIRGDGCPMISDVMKGGVLVGKLYEYYGNNGRGKLASSEFHPAAGVTVLREGEL